MTQRKAILHAVADVLAQITGMAGRVHICRSIPVDGDKPVNLPCVLVYFDHDRADKVNRFTTQRNLSLRIVVIVRSIVDANGQLDDLCEAIEQKMEQAVSGELDPEPELASLVDSCDYDDTVPNYASEDGRAALADAEIMYDVVYYRTPAQTFVDFNTASIQIDMANPRNDPQTETGPDGQIDATATIILNP